MEIKVKDKKEILIYILMLFLIAKPGYISYIANNRLLSTALAGLEAAMYVYIFISWLNNRRISLILILSALYCGILFIATFLSGGSIGVAIRDNIGFVFMVMAADNEEGQKDNLWRAIIIYLSAMIVMDCIAAFAFPEGLYADNYEFFGVTYGIQTTFFFAGANTLGIFVLFWMYFKADYDYRVYGKLKASFYIIYAMSIAFFIKLESLTSIMATLFMFVLVIAAPFINKSRIGIYNIYLFLLIVLAIDVSFVVLDNIGGVSGHFITDVLGATTTFNGRTPIWKNTIELISKRPLLGYGFNRPTNIAQLIGIQGAVHAHNYLLTIGLYGGLIAIALIVIIVVLAAKNIRHFQYEYSGIILTAFFFTFLLEMVFEHSNAKFLWIVFAYAFSLGRQRVEQGQSESNNDLLGWSLII